MIKEKASFIVTGFACLLFQFTFSVSGDCQAWISPKHTGFISVSYTNDFTNRDYFGKGENFIVDPATKIKHDNFGKLRAQGIYFDFGYSLTDKLAVSASIPYLAKRYTTPNEVDPLSGYFGRHKFPDGTVPLDDGNYHGTFQDFDLKLRYNATARPFMITPFLEFGIPSHDYLFFSHAIVGNRVKSLALGVYLGGSLDRFLPNAYLQGRYGFTFDQKVLGISRNRNLGEVEFGYFITPPLRAFTILATEVTHGGLDIPAGIGPPDAATNRLFFHHSQITRSNYLNIGFGGQYSLNDRVDFFGLVSRMLTGRNVHGLTYGLTFGLSWGFGGPGQRPCHC